MANHTRFCGAREWLGRVDDWLWSGYRRISCLGEKSNDAIPAAVVLFRRDAVFWQRDHASRDHRVVLAEWRS